ncbi:hypothetical protein QM467_12270 [Rhodoblastus sp. 17X3]|uniref:hypothetical protein n=1 Tax=Rhodoblastus sp. 17X3 TaxID=3047026 RepID=UPI0024B7DD3B|nr:hypothetical protein [Rhodoblastus sp. 17X3]MDI9848834.1 hypothetical protein [Rhodoblastus sp. 17X3]
MTRFFLVLALLTGVALTGGAATAGERLNEGLMGAGAGAIVGGPVGAVAGGAIGYTAGPSIARGFHHHSYYHRHYHHRY